ncbi:MULTISPECIES: hypothetical protein [unclassified Nocardia]|uniref:hypothetical protein n=1 Tax=unclassified Nocardia TaxID=2637762 RepID=UPI001CE3D123|nr:MULTISPECIES: hypothetical protein [unclassified Nocardia]
MAGKIIALAMLAAVGTAAVVAGTAGAQTDIPSGGTVIVVNDTGKYTVDDIRALARMGDKSSLDCQAEVQKQVDIGASFPNDGKNVMLRLCEEVKAG